jgi:hypothetical protein
MAHDFDTEAHRGARQSYSTNQINKKQGDYLANG